MLRDTWSHLVRKTEQWCSYIEYEQPLYNFCISNYMQQTNVPFDSTIGHSNAFWDSHLSLDMKITDATAHFLTNEFISTENEDQINSWYLKKKSPRKIVVGDVNWWNLMINRWGQAEENGKKNTWKWIWYTYYQISFIIPTICVCLLLVLSQIFAYNSRSPDYIRMKLTDR